MKKIKSLLLGLVFLFVTLFQTSCIGSFKLTNNLYDWNTGLNGKALQEVVFLVFVIVPVYGATLFIDAVILNTIEFWSGSNPMAMNEGDVETQIVENAGNSYQITATKNKFHVEQLTGKEAGQSYNLVYHESERSWYLEANGLSKKISRYNPVKKSLDLIKPDGKVVEVNPATVSKNAVKAAVYMDYAKTDE